MSWRNRLVKQTREELGYGSRGYAPCRGYRTSYPLRKALTMLFRGEMSEGICLARTVTESNDFITLLEKNPLKK